MNIDEIIQKHEQLNKKLIIALSTMERKDDIYKIKQEIINNQKMCPHVSNKYNWVIVNGDCPYCGMHLVSDHRWEENNE